MARLTVGYVINGKVGQRRNVPVLVSGITTGASGFIMSATVTDTRAKFVDVLYPAYGLTATEPASVNGPVLTRISAADIGAVAEGVLEDFTLFTLVVELIQPGSAVIELVVSQFDDDVGDPISSTIQRGGITSASLDLVALRAELDDDPTGLGYGLLLANGATGRLADLLNETAVAIQVERVLVDANEVFEAIVPAEWAGLTPVEKDRVAIILSLGQVDVMGANTRMAMAAAFGPATVTRANLISLQTKDGSRAEELFGQGVSHKQVAEALRL